MPRIGLICQLIVVLVLLATAVSAVAQSPIGSFADSLGSHIRELSRHPSRVSGYPGVEAAADYIANRLQDWGVPELLTDDLSVVVPIEDYAFLTAGADTIALHTVWPNLAQAVTLPAEGIESKLVYGARALPRELDGIELARAIVALEYDCGGRWIRVFDQGAQAVIFLGSGRAERSGRREGAQKFLTISAHLPRLYARVEEARRIRELAERTALVRLRARSEWRRASVPTLVGIVPGRVDSLAHEAVLISCYYDAISPVPAVAPGADQASGIATWLETARVVARRPGRRTAVFVATAGHFQGLKGMRDFIDGLQQIETEGADSELSRRLAELRWGTMVAIDLSSRGSHLTISRTGPPYTRLRAVRPFLFNRIERFALSYEAEQLSGQRILGGRFAPVAERRILGVLPERIPTQSAVAIAAGYNGLGLVTAGDRRELFDSVEDHLSRMNMPSLARQAAFSSRLVQHLLEKGSREELFPERAKDSFATLSGRFVEWGEGSFEPDRPIAGGWVRIRSAHRAQMGVRPDYVELTDEAGLFRFAGVEARTLYLQPIEMEAFGHDSLGFVDRVVDRGPFGAVNYPTGVLMDHDRKERTLVGFRARPLVLTDLHDPRWLTTLDNPRVLDGSTDADLAEFGVSFPALAGEVERLGLYHSGGSLGEQAAALYVPGPMAAKVTMTSGRFGLGRRLVLVNGTPEEPEGGGFLAEDTRVPGFTANRVAADLGNLTAQRLRQLRRRGIFSQAIASHHELAQNHLERARQETTRMRTAEALAHSRAAWALASWAYSAVQGVRTDAVFGVLMVLFALIPFAFCAERLFVEAKSMRGQVAAALAVFALAFFVLRYSHPAFDLTIYPLVVLIGFLILALSAVVIAIGMSRLNTQLRHAVSSTVARHRAESRRSSMVGRALSMGIGQMRRRPLRTGLTCSTLALLTFSLVSFTSVKSSVRFNLTPAAGSAGVGEDAVMFRFPGWERMEWVTAELLSLLFDEATAERVWYNREALLRSGANSSRVAAVLGLSPEEPRFTEVLGALRQGRWFRAGERRVCLLPGAQAQRLEIETARIEAGTAHVELLGSRYRVVGLVDGAALDDVRDIGGAPLAPLDLDAYQPHERRAGLDRRGEAPAFTHLSSRQVAILPAEEVVTFGEHSRLASVAAALPRGRESLEAIATQISHNLFARIDGEFFVVNTVGDRVFAGNRAVWVPLLISILIVANTMMGSVHERRPEISTFNAVGLAPGHVAWLFVAEALAYALLGGMGGYLLAQVFSRVGLLTGLFPGITVNYSSLSAVATLFAVVFAVIGSALYPARLASHLSVPGIERSWVLPRPTGEELDLEMPFSMRPSEARALLAFIAEYLSACDDQSIGAEFYAEAVESRPERLTARIWLTPFDSGVSQDLRMTLCIDVATGYASIQLKLLRSSGDSSGWLRANRLFVDGLRKQLLIWRALPAEERKIYERGTTT
ncbi:MAG: FtsX-like permease family protein [Candidatus Latescibacterota bacterium]|nr:FtsX-like permease family protein [Candidatus Latescibacterota bacterium]